MCQNLDTRRLFNTFRRSSKSRVVILGFKKIHFHKKDQATPQQHSRLSKTPFSVRASLGVRTLSTVSGPIAQCLETKLYLDRVKGDATKYLDLGLKIKTSSISVALAWTHLVFPDEQL